MGAVEPRAVGKEVELAAIYEISKLLSSSLDLDTTLSGVLKILDQFLGMKRGTVTLLDPDTGELFIEEALGLSSQERQRIRYQQGEGITGQVLKTGMPVLIPDIGAEPRFLNKTQMRRLEDSHVAFLAVPIKVGREAIGVLSVDRSPTERRFSFQEDFRFLSMVAGLIGQAVRLSRRVEKERQAFEEERARLRESLKATYTPQGLSHIVGRSEAMQAVFQAVTHVARSRATVFLRGESGTGKELIARAIHYNSPRAEGPFIQVNCAALPETLLESELFGHEKGAFTGAVATRKGRFELAHGGTLFLDEVGEMPLSIQVKLLRVLQERRFERVGGTRTLSADVRIVAATNRDLEQAVALGQFREDLYYRLNVIPIHIPALRERREDIPLLVEHFLAVFNRENGRHVRISDEAMEVLLRYSWPGNVRELENCIERVVVLARSEWVRPEDLPFEVRRGEAVGLAAGIGAPANPAAVPAAALAAAPASPRAVPLKESLKDLEKQRIQEALNRAAGVQAKAARLLGMNPRQLAYRIRKYGIAVERL